MEDSTSFGLMWDTLPHDTAESITPGPMHASLSEPQALHAVGDNALIRQLIGLFSDGAEAPLPTPAQPVRVAASSLLGQWTGLFSKAIHASHFKAWAADRNVDLKTLSVCTSTLRVSARGQPKVYTLGDTSAWWSVANPIIAISHMVDPSDLGVHYLAPLADDDAFTLPLNLVLAFHGYPLPANRFTAWTMVEELRALRGFPVFDDNGRSTSIIEAELTHQQRDFQQLAEALESLISGGRLLFTRDIYLTSLQLNSDSKLARSLREAAMLLQAVINENDLAGPADAPTRAHFDAQRNRICVLAHGSEQEQSTWAPESPDTRWERLTLLGTQLRTHLYPGHSVSLAAVLKAYGFERPSRRAEIRALIQRLRDWEVPAAPSILHTKHSYKQLLRYRRLVGQLNDRYTLCTVLSEVIADGKLHGPEGLDRIIAVDPDGLQPFVNKAYVHLRQLTDDPAFVSLRTREGIDPASHVLLSVSGEIGAYAMDGSWKSLERAVTANDHLFALKLVLMKLAAKTGGQLRTNGAVSLAQGLRLYQFGLPETLAQVRTLVQRLETPLPLPASHGSYWRALTPVGTQPSAGVLTPRQRQQIVELSNAFIAGRSDALFTCLCQPWLAGKSTAEVRAEADYLLVRVLDSPLAQALGETLSDTLHWHDSHARDSSERGSRTALIAAALILSIDPHFDAHPTRLVYLDWQDDYFWGEPITFVRDYLESVLPSLDKPVAALAAHLILSGKGPHLLVREIHDAAAHLSSHTWVLFRQYVMYLERLLPGASRQLTYAQIMSLANLPPEGAWKTFLASAHAAVPIIDWAVVNGILQPQSRYGTFAVNTAVDALNTQCARLRSTLEAFAEPVVTLRETARNDLRRVYPDNPWLDARILMWLPENSPFSESGRFENVYNGPKYSFIDLHMADRLDVTETKWHSSQAEIKYQQMTRRFHLLGRIFNVFSQAFDQKLQQLKAAYRESICYWLSQLTLPQREALENGRVRFFRLVRPATAQGTPLSVGRFGVLMRVAYLSQLDFYECFPCQLVIMTRRDIDDEQLRRAVDTATRQPWMRFDWTAYAKGSWPAEPALLPENTDVVIQALGNELPEPDEIAPPDMLGRRVPRTLDSARSHAVADAILAHQLEDSQALSEKARLPITLEAAVSEHDPWADFLRSMALKSP
ncbi:hypothetical protein IFR35_21975 [Pseudomonas fluorescens]|uniref:hypothetical protein n=1 Tax=Pseudomonas fluorescens TaxID=294 RepID=UPI00177E3D96|nr:hypothetical protein [Pseudomonas fluorescens]MBD8193937.1 hypothetical protein [Pseudomonas fluorescens]MBD8228914.1 hypothetical protein [Pseudomonas fluorescens]MBD8786882.1 hypothetical protein [Pseudomonas fluorescens]MBD8818757.1 hypothetical protein [Pseudomonas fluorescens]